MILKVENTEAVELEDSVIKRILNFYPEEKLIQHKTFQEAFSKGSITIKELKDISDKIQTPWQMFLLEEENLKKELENIEKNRIDKFPKEILKIHKRKNSDSGEITSKRIIDRQIRIQSFTSSQLPEGFICQFAGSLKGKNIKDSIDYILNYFDIDLDYFRSRETAEKAKDYLIKKIQSKKDINISQGVNDSNNILPRVKNSFELFKNTSGFVVKDKKIPFIFLSSEINPDENHYRQIYTLIYLLVVIGMEDYLYSIESYSIKKVKEDKKFKLINEITSGILLPFSVTDKINSEDVNKDLINDLKEKYKVSYTAILFILRLRKKITKEVHNFLKLPKKKPTIIQEIKEEFFPRQRNISTSVKRFCGDIAFEKINFAIKNNKIYPNQAQILIFAKFRKDKWAKYKSEI